MSSVELCLLEMTEKARSFTKEDVTSATGIQHFPFKGDLGK